MVRFATSLTALAFALGITGTGCDIAKAQDGDSFRRDRNQSVRGRPKPEYENPGVPFGGFRFYPELGVVGYYTDNVYAVSDAEQSDAIAELQARAKLASQWSSDALNFSASVDSSFYSKFSDENTTDWSLGVDGRHDIMRGFYINGGLTYSDAHEARSSSAISTGLESPIEYSIAAGSVEIVKTFNKFKLSGRGRYTVLDYQNGDLVGGGELFQGDRDRTVIELGARGDYAISPDTALFLSVTSNQRNYKLDPPDAGVTIGRDSSGIETLFGANFDLTHLVRGEVSAGYLTQNYDDPSLSSTSGFATHTKVEWFIDPLVTLTFAASRDVEDASVDNAGGYIKDSVNFNADYEYRRNIVLGLGLGYARDAYDGIDREDRRNQITGSIDYLINRDASLVFQLAHYQQESSGADLGRDYEINQALIALRLRR